MRILYLAASAALFASTIAFADDTKPVPTLAAATSDPDKPVCHPVTHEGQVVGQTCHTQKEWDHMRFEQQQQLRQYQQQSLFQPH